jgi:uncharacterized cupin superfamily protein
MSDTPVYLIRAAEQAAVPAVQFRHPFNPRSEIELRALTAAAGLQRLGVHLGRVPPGKESFCYHYHHYEEEFVYIIAGRGIAEIGADEFEVAGGDFMAFPAPSPGHHLRNPFDADLVYLMGGERHPFEVGEFPRLRKRAIWDRSGGYIIDVDTTRPFTFDGSERE